MNNREIDYVKSHDRKNRKFIIDINDKRTHSFGVDGQIKVSISDGKIIIDHDYCFNVREDPFYKHDCEMCRYLYSNKYNNNRHISQWYDVYYCKNESTIVARFGNEPIKYISGMHSDNHIYIDAKKYMIEHNIDKDIF